MERKTRVLLFKPGIDGHWRGIMTVSSALTEAGMEVIFAGFNTVGTIVEAAIQEDVDVIGYSVHSGAHHEWTKRLDELLREKEVRDSFLVIIGGAIPHADHETLKEEGADGVFSPGTDTRDIVRFIKDNIPQAVVPELPT